MSQVPRGPQGIVVPLPDSQVLRAREWEHKVLKQLADADHGNYTRLDAPDKYFIGYVGELAVHAWLEDLKAAFVHRVNLNGRSSASEFSIAMDHCRARLEVKTAGKARHSRMMMPEAQRLDAQFFVGARILELDPCNVAIEGWAILADVKHWPIGDFGYDVPSRFKPFAELEPMPDFAVRLSRRLQVTEGVRPWPTNGKG